MTGMVLWLNETPDASLTEAEVRSTVEPIRTDASPELNAPPEFNEIDTDESGQLVGLSPRVMAGDTTDSQQYSPWWADLMQDHNAIIDEQVSSSGTAAKRELAGEQGHGTLQYTQSMEPVIRAGAAFGNDYFLSNPAVIQDGAGDYMNPMASDSFANAIAQSQATLASRKAYNDSLFADFLG